MGCFLLESEESETRQSQHKGYTDNIQTGIYSIAKTYNLPKKSRQADCRVVAGCAAGTKHVTHLFHLRGWSRITRARYSPAAIKATATMTQTTPQPLDGRMGQISEHANASDSCDGRGREKHMMGGLVPRSADRPLLMSEWAGGRDVVIET